MPFRSKHEKQSARELAHALKLLLTSSAKRPETKLERFYSRIQSFAKYVGIPSLLIASILPAYNLTKGLVEYSNRSYVQEVQSRYASELLEKGEIDRAHFITSELPTPDRFDVVAHYNKARILAKKAIRQGQQYDQAQDIIGLLLRLQSSRPWLFPQVGRDDELFGLKLDLVELHTQRGNYGAATALLDELGQSVSRTRSELERARIDLRRAHILVLTSKQMEAQGLLLPILQVLEKHGAKAEAAEGNFVLAKSYQFANDHEKSLRHYSGARQSYEQLADYSGLLRTYNNMGMVYQDARDYERARYYYELQAQLARKLRDNLGLGRALVNLSLIDRNQGEFQRSIERASEAREAFQEQGNKLGIAASLHNLANTYVRTGDNAKAILLSKQAMLVFTELADVRGVARSMGLLGQAYQNLGNFEDAAFYILGAMQFNKFLGFERTVDGKRDLEVHEGQFEKLTKSMSPTRIGEIKAKVQREVRGTLDAVKLSRVGVERLQRD